MKEPIEAWSQNSRVRFLLSESGMLIIGEYINKERSRVTVLKPDETLDLLSFLIRVEKDVFERMEAAQPPASEAARWHQWRKDHGFE